LLILITANTIVNSILLAINFPNRKLWGFRAHLNSSSIIINIARFIGYTIFVTSGFIAGFYRESASLTRQENIAGACHPALVCQHFCSYMPVQHKKIFKRK
jgi:hypothetical protein